MPIVLLVDIMSNDSFDYRCPQSALSYKGSRGWLGGAMVLGKQSVPGRPTILITVGQGGGLDIFTLIYPFSLSLGDGSI